MQGTPQPPPVAVNTGTVFVQNIGRDSAHDIEIVLNYQPQHFQVWPALSYQTSQTPEQHFVIKFPSLGPREYTTIEMLSGNVELPWTLRVRSPLGDARMVNFAPMRVMPLWFNRGTVLLIFVGAFTTIYFVIRFMIFVAGLSR